VFYLDVTYVLQWFSSVSYVFLQVFQTYVTNIVSGCFKSRFGVASSSSPSAASPCVSFLPSIALHPPQTTAGTMEGRIEGWQRGRERTLSLSIMRASSVMRGR
jgi:hypothetical protein